MSDCETIQVRVTMVSVLQWPLKYWNYLLAELNLPDTQ